MSTENSSSKWIVGCLIAGVVGMLLCGGGVVLIGFWGYTTARQVAQQIGPEIQEQIEDMQFAAEWRSPAPDAGPEELLPEAVGDWTRVGYDDSAAIPELAIARDGFHGMYESNGNAIDVYAYRLSFTEHAQLFDEAVKAIETAGYTTRSQANVDMGSYHFMTFSFDPPQRFGRMWWAQDWLFVTMTDEPGVDLESFEREYLVTIQGPGLPGMQVTPSEFAPIEVAPPEPAVAPLPVEPREPSAPTEPQPSEPSTDETAPAEPDDAETAPAEPDASPAEPESAAPPEPGVN